MKKLTAVAVFFVWCAFLSLPSWAEEIDFSRLEKRYGLYYEVKEAKPFTGKTVGHYENGQKVIEANYKDGKKDGLLVMWYKNGKKMEEANYIDGIKDGLYIRWYENGQKKEEFNYKNGKEDGLCVWWYENGQKQTEANYKAAKLDGLYIRWYENGQIADKGNYKDGKMIENTNYKSNGNGTVTAKTTGLMWQQEDDDVKRTWADAQDYCEVFELAGHTDWRLPNIDELLDIIDKSCTTTPSINIEFFPGTNSSEYWSSTIGGETTTDAWYIDFGHDIVKNFYDDQRHSKYVRCVR